MKSLIVGLLLLGLQASPATPGLPVSTVAPNVAGFTIQGSTISLNSFKGKKNVLLVFYRTQG